MSPRVKAHFYHSLAQLIRAGITFPRALEKLSKTSMGGARSVAKRIFRGLERGETVGEACAGADIGGTEAAVLMAVERAGFLDRGLEELSRHFEAIAKARAKIIVKLLYPAFVLTVGVLLLNLPALMQKGLDAYLRATVPVFTAVAAGGLVVWAGCTLLAALAASSAGVDALLRAVPIVGGTRRAFAMNRFCMAYELQLGAGINVLDALAASGAAARSGLVRAAVKRVLPEVRAGAQVGPLLAGSIAFDPEVVEGIIVAEESGTHGTSLRRLSEAQADRAYRRLELIAEWVPRLIYLGVLGYVGWQIVLVYKGYLDQIEGLFKNI